MANYEFYSEDFSSEELREELVFKITLKTKIEQLKLVIKSHEDKIKSEANDDIRRLGICDIQKLYKQIEQTKDLLRRVEENEKRPKGFKAPLKDFLWEYNDGKFRTESELYFRSKQHIDYTEEKSHDLIITMCTPFVLCALVLLINWEPAGWLVFLIASPFLFLIGAILVCIHASIKESNYNKELKQKGIDISKKPSSDSNTDIYITGGIAAKGLYDSVKNFKKDLKF